MSILARLLGADRVASLPYAADSPEGLAARWVRWAASVPRLYNPVADTMGANAGLNQPDDVWFLAGTFGGDVERRCTVRAGSPLFVPAFNMWHCHAVGPPPQLARAYGELVVDGAAVDLDVIATPEPFTVAGAGKNPVTGTRRPIAMTVWGLWKRLDPLPAGRHVIRFVGGDGHGFTLAATYHLDIR